MPHNNWINAITFIYIMFTPIKLHNILTSLEGFYRIKTIISYMCINFFSSLFLWYLSKIVFQYKNLFYERVSEMINRILQVALKKKNSI